MKFVVIRETSWLWIAGAFGESDKNKIIRRNETSDPADLEKIDVKIQYGWQFILR